MGVLRGNKIAPPTPRLSLAGMTTKTNSSAPFLSNPKHQVRLGINQTYLHNRGKRMRDQGTLTLVEKIKQLVATRVHQTCQ